MTGASAPGATAPGAELPGPGARFAAAFGVGLAAALGLAVSPAAVAAQTGASPAAAEPACAEVDVPLDVSIGGTPVAPLAVGGRRGAFLIDTGATASAVDAGTWGVAAGTALELGGPFCNAAHVFVAQDMSAFRAPPGGQQGRIGTDLLRGATVVLETGGGRPTMTVRWGSFVPAAGAGTIEIGARPAAGAGNGVPVIGLAIGPAAFPAQLDTGFDDGVDPGIVQGNPALLAALEAAGVAMRPVAPGRTRGCSGVRPYPRWRVEAADVAVIASDGRRAAAFPPPLVEIKDDDACGGIAAAAAPFAQIGASWLGRFGATVLDGPGGTVWMRR